MPAVSMRGKYRGRGIHIPRSGVFNDDGFFFHHVGTRSIRSAEIDRLNECGIPYVMYKRFNKEEDEQIRRNWRRFARKHGCEDEDVAQLAGRAAFCEFLSKEYARYEFLQKTNFWPKMCHKIPHRSAHQVKRRMWMIFDPAITDGKAKVAYCKGMRGKNCLYNTLLPQFLPLYKTHSSLYKIAEMMGQPYRVVEALLSSYLRNYGLVQTYQYKRLINLIASRTKIPGKDRNFGDTIRRRIIKGDIEGLDAMKKYIPFDSIGTTLIRSNLSCEMVWSQVIGILRNQFVSVMNTGTVDSKREAFRLAVKQVFDTPPITPCEFARFVQKIANITDKDQFTMCRSDYNCLEMSNWLLKHGITGFFTGYIQDEFFYLYHRLTLILYKCNTLLFSKLRFVYTAKEKVHIVALAYQYQMDKFENIHFDVPEFNKAEEGDDDEMLESDALSKARRRMRRARRKERLEDASVTGCLKTFADLKTVPFVEALVVYTTTNYEDWTPPTKLKKYVESEAVLALFPQRKNRDELIGSAERKLAQDYFNYFSTDSEDEEEASTAKPDVSKKRRASGEMNLRSPKEKKKRRRDKEPDV